MRVPFGFLVAMLLAPLASAQLDSNSVTVTASRNAGVQPDQVVFSIAVDAPIDVPLGDVLAAVQNVGITQANFSSVRTTPGGIILQPAPIAPQQPPVLEWTFALPVPIAKLGDTAAALSLVQQSIGRDHPRWSMSFNVQGTQVSQPAQQSQICVVADLLSDARTQAQKLASAAGMTVGNVLALSMATSAAPAGSGVYVGLGGLIGLPAAPCSMTVKFGLK